MLTVMSTVRMGCFVSSVYERAFRSLRDNQPDAKEEAVMLLEAWRAFEADTFSTEQRQVSNAYKSSYLV